MKFVTNVVDYVLDKFAYQVAKEIADGLNKEMRSFVEDVHKETKAHAEKIKKDAKEAVSNALSEPDDKELEDKYGLRDYEHSDFYTGKERGDYKDLGYGIDIFRRFPRLKSARKMMKLVGIIDDEEKVKCPHCKKNFKLESHLWPYSFNPEDEVEASKATNMRWGVGDEQSMDDDELYREIKDAINKHKGENDLE